MRVARWPGHGGLLAPTLPNPNPGPGPDPTPDPTPPPVTSPLWTYGIKRHSTPAVQFFNPNCYLNLPLPDGVLIDPVTPSVVTELVRQAGASLKPNVGTTRYSVPTYHVPPDQPRVPVMMHDNPIPNYKLAMSQVLLDPGMPIPDEYVNQGDSDDEALFYCPETDLAQEFWRLRPITPQTVTITDNGTPRTYTNVKWVCQSFWNITNFSTHMGRSRVHNAGTYPNAPTDATKRLYYEDKNMSVCAARIPFLGTLLTEEDMIRGAVDHPLNLTVINALKEPTTAVKWPASSTDGFTVGCPVREGDRYRFPAGYVIPGSLHPVAQRIVQGIRDYSMIVIDKGGALEIDAEPAVHNYFNGTAPSNILDGFPWADLQVLATGSDANPNPTS